MTPLYNLKLLHMFPTKLWNNIIFVATTFQNKVDIIVVYSNSSHHSTQKNMQWLYVENDVLIRENHNIP